MPDTTPPSLPPPTHLTTPEILRLATVFVNLGVNKLRLTGGEPLLRHDLIDLTQQLSSTLGSNLQTIAMTTNGLTLKRKLDSLLKAGLNSVNISLDTLQPLKFELLTKRKGHSKVFDSIVECQSINRKILKTKVNVVVMKGINDDELIDFIELTRNLNLSIRFIEYMPFDGNKWNTSKFLSYASMLNNISRHYGRLIHLPSSDISDTTKYYKIPDYVGDIGFITSMSKNFCSGCNRLRITADGNLKVCLFGKDEISLRDILRDDNQNDNDIEDIIRQALSKKHFSLGGNKDMIEISKSENRSMVRIGG